MEPGLFFNFSPADALIRHFLKDYSFYVSPGDITDPPLLSAEGTALFGSILYHFRAVLLLFLDVV